MAAVTIRSDFGALENKTSHCFDFAPFYLPRSYGTKCHDLSVFFFFNVLSQLFHSPLSLSSRGSLVLNFLPVESYRNRYKSISVTGHVYRNENCWGYLPPYVHCPTWMGKPFKRWNLLVPMNSLSFDSRAQTLTPIIALELMHSCGFGTCHKHTTLLEWLSPRTLRITYYVLVTSVSGIDFVPSSVQLLTRVRLFVTPWTAARQASLSITNSRSPPKLMSVESVMPFNHLILCRPLLLLPPIFPSIRVFSNESALHIRWAKYWEFQLQHQSF